MATKSNENGANMQNGLANPFNPENKIPDMNTILLKAYNRALWIASKIDNPKTQLDEKLRQRVYMAKVECQYYNVILNGLKDADIATIMIEIENIKKIIEEKKHE